MVAFRRGVCAGGSYTGGWCGSVWLFCDAVLQRIFNYCLPKSYCLWYLIHSGSGGACLSVLSRQRNLNTAHPYSLFYFLLYIIITYGVPAGERKSVVIAGRPQSSSRREGCFAAGACLRRPLRGRRAFALMKAVFGQTGVWAGGNGRAKAGARVLVPVLPCVYGWERAVK